MIIYVISEVEDLGGPYSTCDAISYFLRKEAAVSELESLEDQDMPSHILGYEIDEIEVRE